MKLTGEESVHLRDWPEVGHINELLVEDMRKTRDSITEGLAQRAKAGIKVRQPLATATVPKVPDEYKEVIVEELNVKNVEWGDAVSLDKNITPTLREEGIMREIVRLVQNARKEAQLQVDDRIKLLISTTDKKVANVVVKFETEIKQETLAVSLNTKGEYKYNTSAKVDGSMLDISLEKAEK